MKIIHFNKQPLKNRIINHRQGSFKYVELGEGNPTEINNYNLRWVLSEPDFYSPRHHHNFDQVRIQMKGTFKFDTDGEMSPNDVGFFPEGTFYGPQTSDADTIQLVMQIGGASQNGYLSEANRIEATNELSRKGQFIKGKYYPNYKTGESGKDAFQAIWEFFYKKKMQYPPQRFSRPILMDLKAMNWTIDSERSGIEHKIAWDFGPQTIGLRKLRMQPQSSILFSGPISGFLSTGECELNHNFTLIQNDVFHLQKGELLNCQSKRISEWFIFIHPDFS
jgi:hypothetical protein